MSRASLGCVAGLSAAVSLQNAKAAEIAFFNDTFEPSGPTAATRNNDAGTGFGSDIQWLTRSNLGGAFSVVSDGSGIGTGSALQYAPSGGAQIILGTFDNNVANDNPGIGVVAADGPRVLGSSAGDTLRLRFNFRYVTKPSLAASTSVIHFGLFGDPGTTVITDTSNGATNDAPGYYASLATGTSNAGFSLIREASNDDSSILAGADRSTLAEDLSRLAINDTASHVFQMELGRLSSGFVRVKLYVDDLTSPVLAGDDTSPFTDLGFNLFALYTAADTTNYRIDNVTLETPEPGALGACGILGIGLLVRRRRQKSA